MQNEMPKRKTPERKCIGCNGKFPKNQLIRILRSPEGNISLDFTGKKSGRGAYICKKAACLKKAKKSGRIKSSLECEIPETIYAALEEELNANGNG